MIQKVQFITNNFTRTHWENAELACKAGIKWVQLRIKDFSEEESQRTAEKTQDICIKYGATLIINDQLELAQKLLADGVHLGLGDTPTDQARLTLGEQYIIGGTANTFEHILKHVQAKVDYVGIGPFKYTNTKKNLSPIIGIHGYEKIIFQLESHKIKIPLIAIGGIEVEDIKPLLSLGLYGVAVSSLITSAKDPVKIAEMVLKESE